MCEIQLSRYIRFLKDTVHVCASVCAHTSSHSNQIKFIFFLCHAFGTIYETNARFHFFGPLFSVVLQCLFVCWRQFSIDFVIISVCWLNSHNWLGIGFHSANRHVGRDWWFGTNCWLPFALEIQTECTQIWLFSINIHHASLRWWCTRSIKARPHKYLWVLCVSRNLNWFKFSNCDFLEEIFFHIVIAMCTFFFVLFYKIQRL